MNHTTTKPHKIITKSSIWLLAVLLLAACGSQSRLAFVDVQRALNETKAGKAAKSQLAQIHNDIDAARRILGGQDPRGYR